jgi:hypothetical protein
MLPRDDRSRDDIHSDKGMWNAWDVEKGVDLVEVDDEVDSEKKVDCGG